MKHLTITMRDKEADKLENIIKNENAKVIVGNGINIKEKAISTGQRNTSRKL